MLRIAVCDDLNEDRKSLLEALKSYFSKAGKLYSITEFENGEKLVEEYEEEECIFDLIFMDVFMTGITGMEAVRRVRKYDRKVEVIFLTTSPDFAVDSYDVAAVGYLLKPLDSNKLGHILDKLLIQEESPRLAIKTAAGYRYFDYDEIYYAESKGRSIMLHLAQSDIFSYNDKLDHLEEQLNDVRFLRCHQSYLVNMDCIRKVQDDFFLKDGSSVPIRVRDRHDISNKYHRYFVSCNLEGGDTNV